MSSLAILEKHTGMTTKVQQLPDQVGDVPFTWASLEKVRAYLGYKVPESFDEGIHSTVE